jgi:hypothetical protein
VRGGRIAATHVHQLARLAGLAQLHHLVGHGVERFVPGDRHELRVDAATLERVGALQGCLDAVRVIHLLRNHVAARAAHSHGWSWTRGCHAPVWRGRPAQRSGWHTTACSPGRCWPPSCLWLGYWAWPCAESARCATGALAMPAQPVIKAPAEMPVAMINTRLVSFIPYTSKPDI